MCVCVSASLGMCGMMCAFYHISIPSFLIFYILTFCVGYAFNWICVDIYMRALDALFGNAMCVGKIAKVESVSL